MGVMNEDRLTLYDGLIKTHITNTTVAKETGKGLSTNDYTTTEKNKLAGIADGANKTIVDSVLNTSSENPVQNKVIAGEINTLKKSVSDGKTLVATAITDKGVDTAADATFAVMAANIRAIESGGGVGLNVFTQETEPETKEGVWVQTANPHQSIVVGNETYVSSGSMTPGEWAEISILPYIDNPSTALVYNNEIHIFGGSSSSSNYRKHYKYDGTTWSSVSTLPYPDGGNVKFVVFNDEIHMLGGGNSSSYYKNHYKFDGSAWSSVGTLPIAITNAAIAVYNGAIHVMYDTYHYKYDGTTWSSVGTLPYSIKGACAVVFNDELHVLGNNNSSYATYHYIFDGSNWVSVSVLPYRLSNVNTAMVVNNKIHIMSSASSGCYNYHYEFDGTDWASVTPPLDSINEIKSAVFFNDAIHVFGYRKKYSDYYKHRALSFVKAKYNGTKIAIYQNSSNTEGTYATNFISRVPITGENNKFPSGFDDIYYIDDSGNVEESPTYYGNGTQWIKFKN